jgi:hypothetical protein
LVRFGQNFVETIFTGTEWNCVHFMPIAGTEWNCVHFMPITGTEWNCVHFMPISSLKFAVQVLHMMLSSIGEFYENQCVECCTFLMGKNVGTLMCIL